MSKPRIIKTTRQRLLDIGLNVFAIDMLIKSLANSPLIDKAVRLEFMYRGKEYALTLEGEVANGDGNSNDGLDVDIDTKVVQKMNANTRREYRHGGKAL